MDVSILRERVDEQTDGEPDSAKHGTVEAVLRDDLDGGIGLQSVVLTHLQVVCRPAEECADGQRDVRQAGDALVPAALFAEGDWDHGQEEEDDGPAEGNPEAEGEDDGFGDEHADGFYRGGLEHGLDVGGVDVVFGDVAVVAGGFAELDCAFVQGDAAAGFGEEEEDGDEEGHVGDSLDAFDPAPADGLVDEAGVDRRGDGAEDGDEGEHGHGAAALVRWVHVVEGSADEDGADAAEETEQETQADDGVDARSEREADEEKREAEVCGCVDDLAADQLAEGSQDHGRDGAGHVEGEQTPLTLNTADVELLTHAVDTG